MKLLKRSFVLIIILMIILIPLNIVEGIDKNTSEDYSEQFKEIMDLITERYLDENVTEKELFDAAIGGMLDSLDEYSVYFTEEEKKVFTNAIERAYVGIGVSLKQEEEYVAIDEVFEGGSASKGGILSGDIIKKINGESAKGYKPSQVSKKVLGKEGTEVTITFERNNKEYDITMKRSVVNLPTVTKLDIKKIYKDIDEETASKIGFIKISSFSKNTDKEFTNIIKEEKKKGTKYLILDLRNNTGGYVDKAVNVCNEIIPEGPVLYFVNKEGREYEFKSNLKKAPFQIVAIINENSASATEFVAAAIKESGVGVLVGENTYGKGVAQYMYSPNDEYMIKLTTEEFKTRKKSTVHKKGISPNYVVQIPKLIDSDKRFFLNDDFDQVYNVESILKYLGYEIKSPDTKYDRSSYNAVYKFQKDMGLHPYGVCDHTTQEKLNEEYVKTIRKNDVQLKKAVEIMLNRIKK